MEKKSRKRRNERPCGKIKRKLYINPNKNGNEGRKLVLDFVRKEQGRVRGGEEGGVYREKKGEMRERRERGNKGKQKSHEITRINEKALAGDEKITMNLEQRERERKRKGEREEMVRER